MFRRVTALFAFIALMLPVVLPSSGTTLAQDTGITAPDVAVSLFWFENASDVIKKGNADGSGTPTNCLTVTADARGVVVDSEGGKIYWLERDLNRLRRANINCSGAQLVTDNLSFGDRLAIDPSAGKLYWTENNGMNRIRRVDLDGSNLATVVDTEGTPVGVALDLANNWLYWTEMNPHGVWRATLNGENKTEIVPLDALGAPLDIAVDSPRERIYWIISGQGAIYTAALDGSNPVLWLDLPEPRYVIVDPNNGQVYWGDHGVSQIRRANANGSNNQLLFAAADGVNQPRGLALYDAEPVTCYALTRTRSGQGSDPAATPNKSTGCGTGQYVAGETISVTASPAAGWRVAGWSGTDNDASTSTTNTVTMPASDHTVAVTYEQLPVTCYALTRTHSGQGNDPIATPPRSTSCGTGQYIAGESITLTASPATGWRVAGWSGTNNDGSTSLSNTVTMPSGNHTVSVIYEQAPPTCYALTRTHSGQGSNPVATPARSTSCGTGQYVAGESITLTASAAAGWRVAGWSGTNNDSSTSLTNTVTMPASNHTVSVAYEQAPATCYALTRNHSGQGNDPIATPARSTSCGTGQYVAGESITLTASPAAGWRVAGWSGTNNDSSTSLSNTVTMPAGNHSVSVAYEQAPPLCYALTRSHSGQGSDPIATPARSTSCGTGQYVAGESISLAANPAAGWGVAGWSGTNNDGSTSTTNTVTMPASAHTVQVSYVQQTAGARRTVLPMIIYGQEYFLGPQERENNNAPGQANGPILFNRDYQGYPNDRDDYFYFDLPVASDVTITLRNITGKDPQLHLRDANNNLVGDIDAQPPHVLHRPNLPPGRYYARVVVVAGNNSITRYTLRVDVD